MISFECTCGATLRMKDNLAGRMGKCPKCGNVIRVPRKPREERQHAQMRTGPQRANSAVALGVNDALTQLSHAVEAGSLKPSPPSASVPSDPAPRVGVFSHYGYEISLVVLAALVLGGVLLYYCVLRDTWDLDHLLKCESFAAKRLFWSKRGSVGRALASTSRCSTSSAVER